MNRNIYTSLLFCFSLTFLQITHPGKGQNVTANEKLFFISDCQEPMQAERLYLKFDRNEEARDSLFSDIIHQKPSCLFLLGDLTSSGSNNKSWKPVDSLLHILRRQKTAIYATPGNHEYFTDANKGIQNFQYRFPENSLFGYCIRIDSMAVVMLNSNFRKMTVIDSQNQQIWYESTLHSLDLDKAIKIILVCAHHAPYTNSKITGVSKPVIRNFVPAFMLTHKSQLFISGHSHNLEFFKFNPDKYFLVIGGGGGLKQPLFLNEDRLYADILVQDQKPLYFYITLERRGNSLILSARGIQKDFGSVKDFYIGTIEYKNLLK